MLAQESATNQESAELINFHLRHHRLSQQNFIDSDLYTYPVTGKESQRQFADTVVHGSREKLNIAKESKGVWGQ